MIPSVILDDYYGFDEAYVNNQIQKASLDGIINGRLGGIIYKKTDMGKELLAWQCNLANVQGVNVKLPTIIHIHVAEGNIIKSITLNECFKGSQGIACSWKYLNRHTRNTLLSSGFSLQNPAIADPLTLSCRHTYELVLGSCTFAEHCERRGIKDAVLSESTVTYTNGNNGMIEFADRIRLNGKDANTKISVSNYLDAIKYDNSGAIYACDDMRISGYSFFDGGYRRIGTEKTVNADNSNDYTMKMMKAISKSWLDSGKRLGVLKNFYFSQIWPPTAFGLLSQAFALTMFKDNYVYFQHTVSGLQRIEDRPLCIGVIRTVKEG